MFDIEERPSSPEPPAPFAPPADPPGPPDPPEGGELPLERLEAEICTLAGHLAAATCRWLLLVAEFDRREGWQSWGQASCAAWLSWKCGVSLTTAHDHVRVARALPELPGVREAFAAGRLSFAKVRALTRIADPGNEQNWLEVAASATAAQLDRLVAACRAATRADAAARVSREKLTWRYDDDGTVVITARLVPERGQKVVSALEHLQRLAAEQDRTPPPAGPADSSAEAAAGHGHDHGPDITACHTATITPDALQPAHYDPLHLHYATSVMLTQPHAHNTRHGPPSPRRRQPQDASALPGQRHAAASACQPPRTLTTRHSLYWMPSR